MSLYNYEQDTIAAIATAAAPAAIGIVKISGSKARDILHRLFKPKNRQISPKNRQNSPELSLADISSPEKQQLCDTFSPESRRMYYGWIVDPETNRNVDEVMVVFMQASFTYTREDVCEIYCHGGPAVTEKTLHLVMSCGARLANPGEFTKRAMLSGRIDLRQAESVCELCEARTEAQRQVAIQALISDDNLQKRIKSISNACLEALAWIEASIDFPEEDIETLQLVSLERLIIHDSVEPIKEILSASGCSHLVRKGAKVVLIGRPNVGKSSLFNSLLGSARVIVSPVPGTTRDCIEESLDMDGFLVTITDTAGIRISEDLIEQEGVRIAKSTLQNADHLIAIFDLSSPLTQQDCHILEQIPAGMHVTVVLNKADICAGQSGNQLPGSECLKNEIIMQIQGRPDALRLSDVISISCKTGEGVGELKKSIKKAIFNAEQPDFMCQISLNFRQKILLEKALRSMEKAWQLATSQTYGQPSVFFAELVVIELKDALDRLNELSGNNMSLDILDHIFDRFCIGK